MRHLPVMVRAFVPALFLFCAYPDAYNPLLEPGGVAVSGLDIIIPAARITEADSVLAEAYLILADGRKRPAEGAEWESLTTGILTVDRTGMVFGKAPGRGTVRALYGGMSATGEIEVERRIDYSRIMISEVFYDAAGNDDGKEFIELYNGNDYACDLSGVRVADGSAAGSQFVMPDGGRITAGGYLVIASSRDGFFSLFGAYPDHEGLSCSLNNSGETVRLINKDGSAIDTVFIAGGTADFPAESGWCASGLPRAVSGESVYRVSFEDTNTCSDWSGGVPTPGGQ